MTRDEIESLHQQLAERETQVTLLRDGLAMAVSIIGHPDDDGTKHLQKILADTADLKGVRLCHAEPIGYYLNMGVRKMKTEWTECSSLQELAAAQARGDEIDVYASGEWSIWDETVWHEREEYRCRPAQAAKENSELHQQLETAPRPAEHKYDIITTKSEAVTDYWSEYYSAEGLCSICGNTGVLDTRGTKTPAGVEVGRVNFCICPNGQALREEA